MNVPEIEAEPVAWIDGDPSRPLPFWPSFWLDVVAHVPPEARPQTRLGWLRVALPILLHSAGLHAVTAYRLAHTLRGRGGWPGRLASASVFWWLRHAYACSLASSARLHGGLCLPHPQGIVIGPGAVIGPRAWIFQNVTIGGSPGKAGLPRVGADARIYAGAVLSGPIVVGDEVMIGANVVVSRDVPSRRLVRSPEPEVVPLPGRFLNERGVS